jgi:glycosyltransferase involved in cell wall biosynthesis
VRILQNVGDDELPALYRNCLVFAFPSKAEGFGMPPLEAMASGVATIVADNTALPEVVGSAGLLVPTEGTADLAAALRRLSSDPDLRKTLAERGMQRAREFSWDGSAAIVARAYRRLARRPAPVMNPAGERTNMSPDPKSDSDRGTTCRGPASGEAGRLTGGSIR